MKPWYDEKSDAISRHLSQLRLRCPLTPIYYRQALRSFRDVAVRLDSPASEINRDTFEAWLRERSPLWPQSTLLNRARIVNRFMDFLVRDGSIKSNPVAELRAQYHVKSSNAIVKALLDSKPDEALEKLRQFPFSVALLGSFFATTLH